MAGLMMAVNCATGPCVQVYTNPRTHQLVITANQHRPGSTLRPHPVPRHSYKPRPQPHPVPRVVPRRKSQTWIPYKAVPVVHRAYRPPVKKKKSVVVKIVTTALSLSDQITRLLPGSRLLYQPSKDVVTGIPVYFWSDTNPVFQVVTSILGVGVNVLMSPSFVWNFGDGTTMNTSSAGGPYPNTTVTHIYKTAGIYTATVAISWAGTWAAQGAVLPVLGGAIVQNASATIEVNPGPTDFTR